MCRIAGHDVPLLLFHFRHEAGYETIGDGGPYPYLGEQVVGVFIGHFKERDVDVVKRGYEGIDGEDDPQVALGVALAVEKENEGTSVPCQALAYPRSRRTLVSYIALHAETSFYCIKDGLTLLTGSNQNL